MAIVRWEPFREIERWEPFPEMRTFRREIDRLLEQLMPAWDGGHLEMGFIPAAEMEETGEAVRIKLEVPGLEAKDLDIQVTEKTVKIVGERKSETETEEKGVKRSEFHYGKFERVIPLPARIQNEKVEAEYKNGILSLTLPKVEEEKKAAVKVNVA